MQASPTSLPTTLPPLFLLYTPLTWIFIFPVQHCISDLCACNIPLPLMDVSLPTKSPVGKPTFSIPSSSNTAIIFLKIASPLPPSQLLVRDNHPLHCDNLQFDLISITAPRTMSYNFRSLSVSLCRLWIPRKKLCLFREDSGKLPPLSFPIFQVVCDEDST